MVNPFSVILEGCKMSKTSQARSRSQPGTNLPGSFSARVFPLPVVPVSFCSKRCHGNQGTLLGCTSVVSSPTSASSLALRESHFSWISAEKGAALRPLVVDLGVGHPSVLQKPALPQQHSWFCLAGGEGEPFDTKLAS